MILGAVVIVIVFTAGFVISALLTGSRVAELEEENALLMHELAGWRKKI